MRKQHNATNTENKKSAKNCSSSKNCGNNGARREKNSSEEQD